MRNRIIVILAVVCLVFTMCGGMAETVRETSPAAPAGLSSDTVRTAAHEDITWDLITLAEHDPELKRLLEKSIRQAAEENPDTDTNPVVSLESYYLFIDRIVRAMPWEISP